MALSRPDQLGEALLGVRNASAQRRFVVPGEVASFEIHMQERPFLEPGVDLRREVAGAELGVPVLSPSPLSIAIVVLAEHEHRSAIRRRGAHGSTRATTSSYPCGACGSRQ